MISAPTRLATPVSIVFDRQAPAIGQVGGKLARQAILAASGLPVPRFFCLTAEFFETACGALRESARRRLADISFDDPADVRHAVRDVARLFENVEFSQPESAAILGAFDSYFEPDTLVAVRASMVGRGTAQSEDSADDAFAGISDTFLYVPRERVLDSIRQAWASGFSEKALRYRRAQGLDMLELSVAVGVQQMVFGTRSFVLFTCNPKTASREAVVAAGWGIGEGVVQEKVALDHYFVNIATGHVRQEIARKDEQLTLDPISRRGLALCSVPDDVREQPCLTEAELRALVELGQRIEHLFGDPQDIEGTFTSDGQVHVLQARPITFDFRRMRVWTNANVTESFPGVTTALTFSFARSFYRIIFYDCYRRLGIDPRRLHDLDTWLDGMLGFLHGRVYYCLTSFYHLHSQNALFPMFRAHWERMMGFSSSYHTQPGSTLLRLWSGLRQTAGIARAVARSIYQYARHEHEIRVFHAWWEQLVAPLRGRTFYGDDPLVIIAEFRRVWREVGNHWGITLLNDTYLPLSHGLTETVFRRWRLQPADDPALLSDLLCGEEEQLLSVEIVYSAIRLAESVWRDPDLRAAFRDEPPHAVWRMIERDELDGDFCSRVRLHLHRYGDRGLQELKMEQPNIRHAPETLVRTLQGYARSEVRLDEIRAAERATREAADKRLATLLAGQPLKQFVVRHLLATLRRLIRNRENSRYCRSELFGVSKNIFRALGADLSRRGVLRAEGDVFHLTQDELFGWFDGSGVTEDLQSMADLRRAELERNTRRQVPMDLTTVGPLRDNNLAVAETVLAEQRVLRGLGSSAGRVRGRARLVLDPNALDHLEADAILVARETDPGWLFLMLAARGIVVERGSMLSHTAITGRKFGIPTVVAVPEATRRIRDGALIEVDGASGTVTLLEAEE